MGIPLLETARKVNRILKQWFSDTGKERTRDCDSWNKGNKRTYPYNCPYCLDTVSRLHFKKRSPDRSEPPPLQSEQWLGNLPIVILWLKASGDSFQARALWVLGVSCSPPVTVGPGGRGVLLHQAVPAGPGFSSVAIPPTGFQPITLIIHEKRQRELSSVWFAPLGGPRGWRPKLLVTMAPGEWAPLVPCRAHGRLWAPLGSQPRSPGQLESPMTGPGHGSPS